VAAIASVAAVVERHGARLRRIEPDLELAAEAAHEQTLEASLARIAELGLSRTELATGGVLSMDELEEIPSADLHPSSEDFVSLEWRCPTL
jgi:hypothetical protein